MKFLVATDIFGQSSAVDEFIDTLPGSVTVIDPYQGIRQDFSNEKLAYQHFIEKCGIEKYSEQTLAAIESEKEPLVLIGFSVGASAIWTLLESLKDEFVSMSILFYGSQIRHHLNVTPKANTFLIFPLQEPHFSIPKLIVNLAQKQSCKIEICDYLHGFMNPSSQNFNINGYDKYSKKIEHLVNEHKWQNE